MVGIWSSRWGGRQGIILSYRWVLGKPVVEEEGQEVEEAVLSMSGKSFWKKTRTPSEVFCPSDCRVFSWTRSLGSFSIPFGSDGGLPLPVCKKLAARALYWSLTAMVAKIRMINSVSDNTMWFCKKNKDLLQLDKNRFLSTAYLDNKCKHYTRLMFLIQEMLIVMAVKDIIFFYALYSTSPQAQRIAVERTKASKSYIFSLKSLSNPNKNKQ